MRTVIRIGSRKSRLAVIQAELVGNWIMRAHPETQVRILTFHTSGDRMKEESLETIGGKGLFIRELEQALLEEEIDIAVHSLKDMPAKPAEELPILAYTRREDPRDALIYRSDKDGFPDRPVIGTSSRRRAIQMKRLYPDAVFRGIRGNVETRLAKLEKEGYDGTVLAAAGLRRLCMESVIGRYFEPEEVIPAAGQGILAVQGRKGDPPFWLAGLDDPKSRAAAQAEREFVRVLGGDCTSPTAAYARIEGTQMRLTGLCERENEDSFFTEAIAGPAEDARRLGETLALRMAERSGKDIG